MTFYETIFIIDPTTSDEERTKTIDDVKSFIENEKGRVETVDVWGLSKLAFPIKKHDEGVYVYSLYQAPPGIIQRLEKKLKLTETIIRYLSVKLDSKKLGKDMPIAEPPSAENMQER